MTEEGRGSAGGGERDDANDRFVEGIARPLRAPEKLDETFELRVMSAVHAEARAGRAPGRRTRAPIIDWWLRPRAVRFVQIDPAAHSVSLVGDFNAWEKGATRLSAGDNGAWVASIPLRAGRHEYAFIVEGPDGEQWVADPFARTVHDEFDTESSVIMVGNGTSRTAERSSS
jgi:hypothetical protein